MKYQNYELAYVSNDFLEFEFISIGPKGRIVKVVQFIQTDNEHIYNLAFGNKKGNGEIDDYSTNDNKDRNKILITVAKTVYTFTSVYRDKYVAFKGSTSGRTRLYRMAISLNFEELSKDFKIYGLSMYSSGYSIEEFVKGKTMMGF